MQPLVTIDFHNTLAECDEWFLLEIRDLPVRVLERIQPEALLTHSPQDITTRYRGHREAVIESGVEIDALTGVCDLFEDLGLTIEDGLISDAIDSVMREAAAHATPVPGAIQLVRGLHEAGFTIGVVSSAIFPPFLDWVLTAFGIRDDFTFMVTSAESGHYKSNPEIYRHAMELVGANPRRSIHIGDSLNWDVDSAKQAGMRTVWLDRPVPDGVVKRPSDAKPDLAVSNLADALPWIVDELTRPVLTIDVFTLFPGMFAGYFGESILKRAQAKGLIALDVHDIRDWTHDRHRTADDTPYGGGAGMVMKVEPIIEAVEDVLGHDLAHAHVAIMSAGGRRFTQPIAQELSHRSRIVLICGHYEGIDERVSEILDADELSIGDYVLTGGELAAMTIADAIIRLVPGVITEASILDESHTEATAAGVEYPHYTRPAVYRDLAVPEILLSGNHARIDQWRRERARERTARWRPDLLGDRND